MRVFIACLLCCLWSCSAEAEGAASPPLSLTLKQAIGQALQKHPSLTRLNETHQAAESREKAEASSFLPRLTLEAVEKDGPSGAPGFGFNGLVNSTVTRHTGASLVLSQTLYDFGRTLAKTRSRRFAALSAGADEQGQRAYVVLGVYQSYNNALLAQKQVQLAQQNIRTRELTVKQAQARFDAGLTSRVDVGLAKVGLAEAQVGLVNAQNAVLQAFADLDAAMGVPAGAETYTLEENPTNLPTDAVLSSKPEQEIALALTQRAEMKSVDAQVRAAEETIRAARTGEMPVLRGLASAGYLNVAPGQFGDNHEYAIGLGLSVPLYTGGQVQAEIADAWHQAAALRALREEQAQTIRLQVTRARLTLTSLAQSRQAVAEQLRQAQDSLRLATDRYQEGLGNFLELQQAQLAFLTADERATRLRYETVVAQAALRYALGTLLPLEVGSPKLPPHK